MIFNADGDGNGNVYVLMEEEKTPEPPPEDPPPEEPPASFSLSQNYPNPFNAGTTFSFSLPEEFNTSLNIYDINGRLVRTLVNKAMSEGPHEVEFSGTELQAGIYLYRVRAGQFTKTKKMVLLK